MTQEIGPFVKNTCIVDDKKMSVYIFLLLIQNLGLFIAANVLIYGAML